MSGEHDDAADRTQAAARDNLPPGLHAADVRKLISCEDPLIIEVGANVGQTTAELLREMPNATVFAFEPDPRAIAEFRRNITHPNVRLFEYAVGAANGTVTFHQSGGAHQDFPEYAETGWHQSGSIRRPFKHRELWPWITFESRIEVPIVTLDAWAAQHGVTRADFIWADTQGAESDLILGATRLLAATRYLYTEYCNAELYEGQATLMDLQRLLPEFDVIARFPVDVLFRNRTL